MKTKKIIALGLTFAMAFALTACGSAFNSTTSKISKVLDKAKYEKIDEKDYDEDEMEDAMEDGCYVTLKDEKNIKDFASSFDFKKKDVKSAFAAAKMDEDSGVLMAMVLEFTDKDKAQKFFDNSVEELEDEVSDSEENGFDCETNEDDNFFQFAQVYENKDWDAYMASYEDVRIDGTTVSVITVTVSDEDSDLIEEMDSICEALKIDSLSELA